MKQIIHTDHAPKAVGPYSQAVQIGNFLFCSGQIAIDPKTQDVFTGDIKTQTQMVLSNVEAVLKASGMNFSHVVKTTIFLTSMSDFATVNEIYATRFSQNPPARSTVAVAALPKGVNVEIEVIAEKTRNFLIGLLGIGCFLVIIRLYQSINAEPMNLWQAEGSSAVEADCGVVLTGAPGRVREALEILAQKKIKKLIVSGVYKEARLQEIFPHLSFYPEVNPDDIILEKNSETTFGNAQQSLNFIENMHCRDILLMTSQLHMSRAYMTFRASFS